MSLFRRRSAPQGGAAESLERLAERLRETGVLPLKRIPLEDLSGPAREIAELIQ